MSCEPSSRNMLISIIVTSYNRPNDIKNTLASILKQEYQNLEIIITDDCSPTFDSIKSVIEEFNDKRMSLISTLSNVGFVKNLLNGYSHTNGEYVIHISDDDILLDRSYIKTAVQKIQEDSEIDVVFGEMATVVNDCITPVSRYKVIKNSMNTQELINDFYRLHPTYSIGSMMIKKEIFKYFFDLPNDSKYYDDLSIFNIIMNTKKGYFLDQVVYGWRQEQNSRCNNNFEKIAELTKFFLTVPLYIYDKYGMQYNDMVNNYILERLEWIVSNYNISKNDEKFIRLLSKINIKEKEIYIYGKSEVGIRLKDFLEANGFVVQKFIDDNRKSDDIIGLNELIVNKNTLIIIGTYKANLILKIYKNIVSKFANVEILELLNDV